MPDRNMRQLWGVICHGWIGALCELGHTCTNTLFVTGSRCGCEPCGNRCHTGVTAQIVIGYPQCCLSTCETACGRPSAELPVVLHDATRALCGGSVNRRSARSSRTDGTALADFGISRWRVVNGHSAKAIAPRVRTACRTWPRRCAPRSPAGH